MAKGAASCPLFDSVSLPAPLPDGPTPDIGTLPGAFEVSGSGEANYAIPFVLPPAPHDLNVSLGLEYRTNGGDGYVGTGFSISGLSMISRCPRTFARDLEARPVEYDFGDLDELQLASCTRA